jgi:succinylglutamic semialdehyde dehydrogenase
MTSQHGVFVDAGAAFVAGRWILAGPGPRERRSPHDLDRVASVWSDGAGWIDQAVEEARSAQRVWRRASLDERFAVMDAFARAIEEDAAVLASVIVAEVGKTGREARSEVAATASKWPATKAIAARELQRRQPLPDAFYDLIPLGVIAVIGPFNFPIHLSNGHIMAALVAGNSVILKPSESAPASAARYVRCWERAAAASGAPAALLQLVQGPGTTGALLAGNPGIDGVAFTGSYPVGVSLLTANAAQTGKLIALELGGKNTSIVLADAPLDVAVDSVVASVIATTGQRCTCTSRMVVDEAVADAVVSAVADRLRSVVPGDPEDESTPFGPLATESGHAGFVEAQQQLEGLESLVVGGAIERNRRGYWVRPAMHRVTDVAVAAPRIERELFGPELLVEVVRGEEAAVSRANATPYGLAMSLFTGDLSRFERLRTELDAGLVQWNRPTVGASALLPFGGVKRSGNHRPAGAAALLQFVRPLASMTG